MKSINKMAVATVLALSSAGLASATTYHVTGSTAYRVADVTAEVAYCGTGAKATYYGSSLTDANYSVITTSDGTTTRFENYFNGSVAGDEALVDGVTKLPFPSATDFPPTTIATTGSTTTAAAGGTAEAAPTSNATLAPYNTDPFSPDIAFSDVFFDTAQQIIKASSDTTNSTPSGGAIVGIVPFVFVCNASTDVTDLTGLSMDPQKFTYGWQSQGSETLSFFTGANADESVVVYPLGRDVDSGTRGTALSETGYPLTLGSDIITTVVDQYYPYNNSTNAANDAPGGSTPGSTMGVIGVDTTLTAPTIGAFALVPPESIDGYSMPLGDGGYYSGGNLATAMSTAFASGTTDTVVMTYLGVSDANAALTAKTVLASTPPPPAAPIAANNRVAATLMAYCGVTFYPTAVPASGTFPDGSTSATNAAKIYEGKYTFWGYEHCYYKSTASALVIGATGTQTAPSSTSLAGRLSGGLDQLSSNGVTFAGMNVGRDDDGDNVQ